MTHSAHNSSTDAGTMVHIC